MSKGEAAPVVEGGRVCTKMEGGHSVWQSSDLKPENTIDDQQNCLPSSSSCYSFYSSLLLSCIVQVARYNNLHVSV